MRSSLFGSMPGIVDSSNANTSGMLGCIQMVRRPEEFLSGSQVIMKLSCRRNLVPITIFRYARVSSSTSIGGRELLYSMVPMK